jgi:hypothetical protein
MMVCRYDDARLMLVLQVDHSRVAGLFAAHWGNAEFSEPRPYTAMTLAAQEHDSGWWEWETQPTLTADGYPPDYIGSIKQLGQGTWLGFMDHGVERAMRKDPYAGLIVAMHAEGLCTQGKGLLPYMPDYTPDPAVREFLAKQETLRGRLMAELIQSDEYRALATDEQIWTNFKLIEVFDQLAQFVCNRYPFNSTVRKNGPTNRLSDTPVPVRPGRDDVTLTVDVQDETRAILRPYPFDVDPLVVSFPARLVPNRPYESEEDFLRHFYKAERVNVTYTLHAG